MIHKDYCSTCKIKNVSLVKYAKKKYTQYYLCTKCNNTRIKKYRKTKTGYKISYNALKRSIKKYPEKQLARNLLNKAVSVGKKSKPSVCGTCQQGGRIEGHHKDYSKPLDVTWLCTSCHANYHR